MAFSAIAIAMRRVRKAFVAGAIVGGVFASAVAFAGPDDKSAAEAALHDVDSSPKKNVVAEMTARAKSAQERAARLRASGDETHARIADGLARTWAEAARDAVRAAELEEKAFDGRRAASDAGARADRERALLEEAIAQSGRLRAQLDALDRESKEQPARTSTQAAAAGLSKPAKPEGKPAAAAKDGGAR